MNLMARRVKIFILLCFCLTVQANEICYNLENAYIVAQDEKNTFLGKIENSFSGDSIFNEFGDYGSEFSSYSATNSFTFIPPIIIKEGKLIGYISTNKTIPNTISPSLLKILYKGYF